MLDFSLFKYLSSKWRNSSSCAPTISETPKLSEAEISRKFIKNIRSNLRGKNLLNKIINVVESGEVTMRILKYPMKGCKRLHHGDIVKINLIGKMDDGSVVETKCNSLVQIGDFEIIPGLDFALELMSIGQTVEVIVNSRYAYGQYTLNEQTGKNSTIPPNTRITYEIQILERVPQKIDENSSYELRRAFGLHKRDLGNYYFYREEYNIAIKLYQRAKDFFFNDILLSDFNLPELLDMFNQKIAADRNLAIAQGKMKSYDKALETIENILFYQPKDYKALNIKAWLLHLKGEIKASSASLELFKMFQEESEEEIEQQTEIEESCLCFQDPEINFTSKFPSKSVLESVVIGIVGLTFLEFGTKKIISTCFNKIILPGLIKCLQVKA